MCVASLLLLLLPVLSPPFLLSRQIKFSQLHFTGTLCFFFLPLSPLSRFPFFLHSLYLPSDK